MSRTFKVQFHLRRGELLLEYRWMDSILKFTVSDKEVDESPEGKTFSLRILTGRSYNLNDRTKGLN